MVVPWGLSWNSCALLTCSLSAPRRLARASSHGSLRVSSSKRGPAPCKALTKPLRGVFANEPMARADHITKPWFKGHWNKLSNRKSIVAIFFFSVYRDRGEFLVMLGGRSSLILGVNGVTLHRAQKDWRSQWSTLSSDDLSDCREGCFSSAPNESPSTGDDNDTHIHDNSYSFKLKHLLKTSICPVQNSDVSSQSQSSFVWLGTVNTSWCHHSSRSGSMNSNHSCH